MDYARTLGSLPSSTIAAPVFVGGRMWGIIFTSTMAAVLPEGTESRITDFAELVATAIANAESRDSLALLADEQAALRRVATLVADGAGPEEVFPAVAAQVDALLGAGGSAIVKFEEDGVATVLGDVGGPHVSGKRVKLDRGYVVDRVRESHRSARFDTDDPTAAGMPSLVRSLGIRSAVASPIVVEGEVWGAVTAASIEGPLASGAERRLTEFTELVATAVSNTQSRIAVQTAADLQGALRRVATLVAESADPSEVFAAVTREVALVLDADASLLCRVELGGDVVVVGTWARAAPAAPPGFRMRRGGMNLTTLVLDTGRPARIDDYEDATGDAAEVARMQGVRSAVGAPIFVGGRLWGLVVVGSSADELLPPGAELRLAGFTELVATAIANAEARHALERVASEQAALRRVATLVATEAPRDEIFTAVAEGVAGALGEELRLVRFEGDLAVVVATSEGPHSGVLPLGTRLPVGGNNALSHVFRTGEPTRIDDYSRASGPIAEAVRSSGLRSIVATPIVVEGRTWGAMIVGTFGEEPVPQGTEGRLAEFAELMATGIANTEARAEIERLAEQQAALRRVATLVARRAAPEIVFGAVAEEASRLLGADFSALVRVESDDSVTVIAAGPPPAPHPTGERVAIDPGFVVYAVRETGRSARFETDDPAAEGTPDLVRRLGVRSAVGSPIVVEDALWGAVILCSLGASFPPETEQRLDEFTELVATGISNATARAELVASRARIVAASDQTRRRIERNLHDGTQQRLVSLGLAVRAAEASLPPERDDLRAQLSGVATGLVAAVEDLQEISRGIHPAILAKGGLAPALQALAHRSAIPVDLDITAEVRLAEPIEVAAYFVASEALANAAKHSEASRIDVLLEQCGSSLVLSIADDGVGGADISRGSGLIGLSDRVEALGGSIRVSSRPGDGTQIRAELPLELELPQPAG
jgi:signal transduction histidine kinase